MEATVISVQPNVTKTARSGKPYTVHLFTYQGDPYQGQSKPPTTRDVFTQDRDNPELAGKVLALQPGQRVQLTFVKNGQYPNLTDVFVLGGQQQQTPPHQATGQEPGAAPYVAPKKDYAAEREVKEAEKQVSIIRQVALKAAVEVMKALLAREGQYKKKMELDVISADVQKLAGDFEMFIHTAAIDFNPAGQADDPNLPDPPFPTEEQVPY